MGGGGGGVSMGEVFRMGRGVEARGEKPLGKVDGRGGGGGGGVNGRSL